MKIDNFNKYVSESKKMSEKSIKSKIYKESVKPISNGFKEIIGAYITWYDGTSDRYTGDLQIQPSK